VPDASKASPKTEGRRAHRGTGFPTLSLPEATKIVEKAGKYGRAHSAAGLATHMGLTTDNSGTFNARVAALKDWGFITGRRETGFNLTEAAMIIAHPTSADATRAELVAAFHRSNVFGQTYETLAKGPDLEVMAIGNLAVNNLGVAIASKGTFARSFVESAIVVGLAERADKNTVRLKPVGVEGAPEIPAQRKSHQDGGEMPDVEEAPLLPPPVVDPPAVRPVLDQVWQTAAGEVRLQILHNSALPARLYAQVGKVAEEIERLAAMLDGDGASDGSVSN
jgi:hypothetical protein